MTTRVPEDTTNPRTYTQAEAARVLGVTRARVNALVNAGTIRTVTTAGGTRLAHADDVDQRAGRDAGGDTQPQRATGDQPGNQPEQKN